MTKLLPVLIALLCLGGCEQHSAESEPVSLSPRLETARARAMVLCAGCHGPEGVGTADFNPNLACQKKVYMVKQLGFYRDGTRTTHPPMANIARMLSEREVEDISEWYSITGCQLSGQTIKKGGK